MLKILPAVALLLIGLAPVAWADSPEQDFATSYTISDSQAVDGDILVSTGQGIVRAQDSYTSNLFGVLQTDPTVVYRSSDTSKRPVARTGLAQVNVTTLNGPIKKGDYITSSTIAGKGQKASQSGYVVGVAMSNFSQGTPIDFQGQTVSGGQISVALRIEYAEISSSRTFSRLLDTLNSALFKNLQSPDQFNLLVRYILAGIIALMSLAIGYLTFTKSLGRSIEAVGRNPLARSSILLALILNIALTLTITLIGIGVAILVLRL